MEDSLAEMSTSDGSVRWDDEQQQQVRGIEGSVRSATEGSFRSATEGSFRSDCFERKRERDEGERER